MITNLRMELFQALFDTLSSLLARYSRHTADMTSHPLNVIRQRSAQDNQPSVMPANVLMHDDDGMGPTFDPFNFSHERREITPAF